MNIQHLLQDNASYDILPDTSDVQSSAHDRINLQSLPLTTSQAQLEVTASLQSSPSAQDPRFTINSTPNHDNNQDVNEQNPDAVSHACDSQELRLPDNASDQHSSHGNNSLERHPPSEGDKRRGEETQIGESEEQEDEGDEEVERDEQQAEGEEDREVDQNDDKDDNEHNEEPQTKLSDAITTKRTNTTMLGKENEHKTRDKENKAISPAKPNSSRKSKNESKRTSSGQELLGSPSTKITGCDGYFSYRHRRISSVLCQRARTPSCNTPNCLRQSVRSAVVRNTELHRHCCKEPISGAGHQGCKLESRV
jgi:hypothetical protein